MLNMPSVRLTVPKAAAGEITRQDLTAAILGSSKKLIYIHAGAGYGKTTLLSQAVNSTGNAVWLSLDGEDYIFTFANALCEAIKQTFPEFYFAVSEYMPFSQKENVTARLAGALICGIESIPANFILVMDDLHTIEDNQVKMLIACLIKYPPKNVRLCFGSREAPWEDFLPFIVRGELMELTQKDLAFTREEAAAMLGFDDTSLYGATEGWPLAIGFFKVLMENGIPIHDIPAYGKEALYAYLFHECLYNLNTDMADFLKKSACFDELDPQLLDHVLDKKNTRLMLESLTARNIFTIKTGGGFFRYHSLFRSSLLETGDKSQRLLLLRKAARYYFAEGQYTRAARYAMDSRDGELLEKIILTCYRDYIKAGRYNELGLWFDTLDDTAVALKKELLVAQGTFLSSIGNFTKASLCLDRALPLIREADRELYIEAMVHKARVLRNCSSFEESNRLLDELIAGLDQPASELAYTVIIEKLYNLCWDSQINEAHALACSMIEACAKAGNLKVKAWFERYFSVVHFLAGRMKEAVYYYEKALELPENERRYLGMHNVDIYIAKAYQMLGERGKAVSLVTSELQTLRSTGRYEELWLGYLFAAEIHYQNAFIDSMNGGSPSYETTMKYFTLADEYAPLYRKTESQLKWAKMQRNIYSLICQREADQAIIDEILASLDQVGDYFKTIALARLLSYFGAISDYASAVQCAKLCIEIGERSGMMLMATGAYGMLARAAIAVEDRHEAAGIVKRFLRLCDENGVYEYFRMREAYGPILEFALDNGIEPEFAKKMTELFGYGTKKLYIETLGAFTGYHDKKRQKPLKFRTKKERELFAFLLDAGDQGATKEQIHNAVWWDSESNNIKNLIAVNLGHLKNDLGGAGIKEAVVCRENRYFVLRNEMECDTELFEAAAQKFQAQNSREAAQKLLSLYKGEYLSDFEALWATAKRIRYCEIYEEALKYCL
jgi:DNA-binding SARP family transcriptional activator